MKHLTLKKKVRDGEQSIIVSPFFAVRSILMCLTGAEVGSETSNQLKQVLNIDEFSNDEIFNFVKESMIQIESIQDENFILKEANLMYFNEGLNLKKDFIKYINEYFHVDVETLNFESKCSRESRAQIRKWCSKKNNKFYEFIGLVFGHDRLFVFNVINFKAKWLYQFNPKYTNNDAIFTMENGNEFKVEMMKLIEELNACEQVPELNSSVFQLPYAGGKIYMSIVLPKPNIKLSEVESRLDFLILKKAFEVDCLKKVEIHLPKFNIGNASSVNKCFLY